MYRLKYAQSQLKTLSYIIDIEECLKKHVKEPEGIQFVDNSSKLPGLAIAGAVVSFRVGAGLVALGIASPIAISVVTLIANAIVQLLSAITERFSSPPGSSVDSGVKVDGASADHNPYPVLSIQAVTCLHFLIDGKSSVLSGRRTVLCSMSPISCRSALVGIGLLAINRALQACCQISVELFMSFPFI